MNVRVEEPFAERQDEDDKVFEDEDDHRREFSKMALDRRTGEDAWPVKSDREEGNLDKTNGDLDANSAVRD